MNANLGGSVLLAGVRWVRALLFDPTKSKRYRVGTLVEPIPAAWARWNGAVPAVRGTPENTILAVPGLSAHRPAVRAALLDVAELLGIPVDSLAIVIAHESGWKADATNPLGAFGLIQLTEGARLPGFTASALAGVACMLPEAQLEQVVVPYYRRFGAGSRGAHPGRLAMQNFLPSHASAGEGEVLARKGDNIYQANPGFDRGGKGYFTVGDVYASFAQVATRANAQRIAVDGRILPGPAVPPAVAATPAPRSVPAVRQAPLPPPLPEEPAEPPPQFTSGLGGGTPLLPPPATDSPAQFTAHGGSDGAYPAQLRAQGTDDARGLLLAAVRAGRHHPIAYMELEVPAMDLVVTILREPLRAQVEGRWLRLGVTYTEQIEICRRLGLVSPTKEIVDAAWAFARGERSVIAPTGLVQSPADSEWMMSLAFARRHNDNIDAAIAKLSADPDAFVRPYGKAWLIHPRMVEADSDGVYRGVVEYGWQMLNGKPIQGPGSGRHDADYMDYSMVTADLVLRRARRLSTGETVDVLDRLRELYPDDRMASVIEAYR